MIQSLYTAATGVMAQQKRIDTIAHNVANVNTYGYKSMRVDFKDNVYQTLLRPVQPQEDLDLQRGVGLQIAGTPRNFTNGSLLSTGNALDFAISGDGFFAVQGPNGEIRYTRNGALTTATDGDHVYLSTGNGEFILDEDGQRIEMQGNREDLTISEEGVIAFGEQITDIVVGIYAFDNRQGLSSVGDNSLLPTIISGAAQRTRSSTITQGVLEGSNVDIALEMTRLVRAQRAFSLASRAMTTSDEMEATANNMR